MGATPAAGAKALMLLHFVVGLYFPVCVELLGSWSLLPKMSGGPQESDYYANLTVVPSSLCQSLHFRTRGMTSTAWLLELCGFLKILCTVPYRLAVWKFDLSSMP